MAAGVDNSFTLEDFKQGFSIQVVSLGAANALFGGCALLFSRHASGADTHSSCLLAPQRAGDIEV